MLSDHERKTLREIQRQLIVDDPELERSFRALDTAKPAQPGGRRWPYTVVLTVAGILAILLLLAGSPGSAFAFGLMAVSVWLARHFHDAATGRGHDD